MKPPTSPVYCVSAAAWSMAVVENATIFGVEVAVDTTFARVAVTLLTQLCRSFSKPVTPPSQPQKRIVVALNPQSVVC